MTLCINIFGGPGVGKSTLAALVFAELKRKRKSVELVTEFAKDLVWENSDLKNQPLIFGTQLKRIERLVGKVDYIVTDSPLKMQVVYAKLNGYNGLVRDIDKVVNNFNNVNFLLQRNCKYDTTGRVQNVYEAKKIDEYIVGALSEDTSLYTIRHPSYESAVYIVEVISSPESVLYFNAKFDSN